MKLGCKFENDYLIGHTLFKEYIIKYSDIEKMVYVKWTFWNFIWCAYYEQPAFIHIYYFDRSKNKKMYVPFFLRYKDIHKIPKKLKYKLEIIKTLW